MTEKPTGKIDRRDLLKVTGAGSLILAGAALVGRHTGAQTPAASPVASPQATPVVAIPNGTLFDITFKKDWQPSGQAQGAFYKITLPVGQALTYLPGPYCGCSGELIKEGTVAEQVVAGSYSVELEDDFIIQRADGSTEEIKSGTPAELTTGDTAIYPQAITKGHLANSGNSETLIYGASITGLDRDEGSFVPEIPPELSARLSVAVASDWSTLGDGDKRAVLAHTTIDVGGSLDPYEIAGLEAIYAATGSLNNSIIKPGEDAPAGEPKFIRENGTVAFRIYAEGSKRLLANPGDIANSLVSLTFSKT